MKITIDIDGQEKTFDIPTESDRAEAWELRYEELEQENRDLKEHWEYARQTRAEACEAKAQEVQKRMALEKELRDVQEKLDKRVDCNERIIAARDELRKQRDALMKRLGELEQETKALRERIQEQDVTIAKYDDENRKLRRLLGVHAIPLSIMEQADSVYAEARGIGKAFRCWAGIIHDNAVKHGWWDEERSFGDIVALCHSELSEALEEYRNGKPMSYEGEKGKPEGVAVEMIDCIIRILDWCGKESIDVDGLLAKKHEYNKGRPFRHGGKKL